jgi:hypothetical protein
VPQVRIALGAYYFGADHAMADIAFLEHGSLIN